jgi:Amino-transferase class IV
VDPTAGLLETLLAIDGRPIFLDSHLERLKASAEAVFGESVPGTLAPSIEAAASGLKLGRLRAAVSWTAPGEPRSHIEAAEVEPDQFFPAAGEGRSLHPVEVEGSLGPHKWANRSWMEELNLPLSDSVPLLVSARTKEVLETIRGNVFMLKEGALITPALDGRILPGIAREQTIEVARDLGVEVAERPIHLDELLQADEVFTTASVRGIEPIGSIAAAEFGDGPDAPALAAKLRRVWLQRQPQSV